MTYTVEQVESAVNAYDDGESYDYFYEEIQYSSQPIHLPELGEAAVRVASTGGHEGDGDYMDVVFKIGDQLFRKSGYHNSWDSNDWDGDLEEVEAFEKVVIDYRAI
jgi:hypothetical protein